MSRLDEIEARDSSARVMLDSLWGPESPVREAAADRHTLLGMLSTAALAAALASGRHVSVAVSNASLARPAAIEAAKALRAVILSAAGLTADTFSAMRAHDEQWATVHDGWPAGSPAMDVAADRHTLLELLSAARIADALTAVSASSVSVRNASLSRAAAVEAAEALRDAMAWIAEGL